MKIIPDSRRRHYAARAIIFLGTVVLIAGMAGCYGYNPPSQNLEIWDWYDLDAVRDNLDGDHILMNDLGSTTPGYEELASPTANGGKGWQPIGFWNPQYGMGGPMFRGTFDGQGFEIHDLYVNRPDEDYVGLFGDVDWTGVIQDIGVVNVTAVGKQCVGGLAGSGETVTNCYSTGSVTGDLGVGGLVGGSVSGTVSNSHSTSTVTGIDNVGGLVGANAGTVSNSYATGCVIGSSSVGGLVGDNSGGTVSNSYSNGRVAGNYYVGGLVGENTGTVNSSYSTGNVTGSSPVGGLVGENTGTVSNSYSTGNVTGNMHVGGLVGFNFAGSVSDSFWDIETSGQSTSHGGTGKNTTEMQDIATFSGAGWNIIAVALNETNPAYIWNIVNNMTYPFLSWQS